MLLNVFRYIKVEKDIVLYDEAGYEGDLRHKGLINPSTDLYFGVCALLL